MSKAMRLSLSDEKMVYSLVRNITKLDKTGIPEREIKQLIYQMGVYVYRQLNHAGIPADIKHPRLDAPKVVWSKEKYDFVTENTEELVPA